MPRGVANERSVTSLRMSTGFVPELSDTVRVVHPSPVCLEMSTALLFCPFYTGPLEPHRPEFADLLDVASHAGTAPRVIDGLVRLPRAPGLLVDSVVR